MRGCVCQRRHLGSQCDSDHRKRRFGQTERVASTKVAIIHAQNPIFFFKKYIISQLSFLFFLLFLLKKAILPDDSGVMAVAPLFPILH